MEIITWLIQNLFILSSIAAQGYFGARFKTSFFLPFVSGTVIAPEIFLTSVTLNRFAYILIGATVTEPVLFLAPDSN